jgi:putative endonuclease
MFYTYILKSLKDNTYYYGSTENIENRLKNHNSGKVRYSKGHLPYLVQYYETFQTRSEAFQRERFFKSVDGYKWLKTQGII